MAQESFSVLLNEIGFLSRQFDVAVDSGFLVFCRMLGFMLIAPIFGRKDIPFTCKVGMALMLSLILLWVLPVNPSQASRMISEDTMLYTLQVFINASIGFFLGFIATAIMDVVGAAGSMMNNQIGLSSAMMFDPSTRQQVALTEKLFSFIALLVFFHIGGAYWIISALKRSFEIFPLYTLQPDFTGQVSLDYIIQITGNSIAIATQLVAPILVVTMAIDLILGIVNRTAQQIQVFQLSFALKPCIGIAAFLLTLPIFIKLLENYLSDYAAIF